MRILFTGAHSDDIEIGAAGLLARLLNEGHDVAVLVLTDDPASTSERRAETLKSMSSLGVSSTNIFFTGFPDGRLECNGDTVARVREVLHSEHRLGSSVVVTHTEADSHNDHRAAADIMRAALRHCVFLRYSIHISVESDRFQPKVFVALDTPLLSRKREALEAHASQTARINKVSLGAHEKQLAALAGLDRCEAFEVAYQDAEPEQLAWLTQLSDSFFHKLWLSLIEEGSPFTLLYEGYEHAGAPIDWPTQHESEGRDMLRTAFARRWLSRSPLRELPSNAREVWEALRGGSVLLVGGAVSNCVVRDMYNRLEGLRWAIDYDMPRSRPAYLWDRVRNKKHYPRMSEGHVVEDFGYFARLSNPFGPGTIIATAASSGVGTRACLQLLSRAQPTPILEALTQHTQVEVPVRIDTWTGQIRPFRQNAVKA